MSHAPLSLLQRVLTVTCLRRLLRALLCSLTINFTLVSSGLWRMASRKQRYRGASSVGGVTEPTRSNHLSALPMGLRIDARWMCSASKLGCNPKQVRVWHQNLGVTSTSATKDQRERNPEGANTNHETEPAQRLPSCCHK